MNRFFNRLVSLVLAVAFLFSAAAISFFTIFGGVTVYAATTDKALDIISVMADGKDMLTTAFSGDETIKNLIITVNYTGSSVPAPDFTGAAFAFVGGNFTTTGTPSVEKKPSGTNSYDIKVTTVTFAAIADTIDFTLTPAGSTDAYSASRNIKTKGGSKDCSLTNYSFFDSTGGTTTSVSGGATVTLVLSIKDGAINEAKLKALVASDGIGLKINKENFTPSSTPTNPKGWEIDPDSIFSDGEGGVIYEIRFVGLYYTGKSNKLSLNLVYGTGYPTRTFPTYTLESCIVNEVSSRNERPAKDDDDSSSSRPDIAPPTPTLIVSSFDYGGATVTAASNFTLKLVVTNTSKKLPIDNIVVKVTVPEAFTMNGSSNSFYIEKLLKDSSQELTLNLSVKPNAEPISHPIKIAFGFESVIDEVRKPLTADQEISIPVGQLDRFTLKAFEVPGEIYVGEDSSFEVSFINKGKTPVYNISAEITGNLSQPGQLQFMGNLESGKEDSADFLLGALEGGVVTGEVIITYEDANMHVTEIRKPFSANAIVMDMGQGMEPEVDPTAAVPETLPWYQTVWATVPVWGWAGGGLAGLIFIAFAVKLIRAHREKKREEQDEDF